MLNYKFFNIVDERDNLNVLDRKENFHEKSKSVNKFSQNKNLKNLQFLSNHKVQDLTDQLAKEKSRRAHAERLLSEIALRKRVFLFKIDF